MNSTARIRRPGGGRAAILALALAAGCATPGPSPAPTDAPSPSTAASPMPSLEPASLADTTATRTWLGPMSDAAFPGASAQPIAVESVTWSGEAWVAVGWDVRGGVAWTSPDGVTWAPTGRQPSLDLARMLTVAAAGGRLVAGGIDASGSAAAWYSDDGGSTWPRAADTAAMRTYGGPPVAAGYRAVAMESITALAAGGYVAVGSLGCDCQAGGFAAWRSDDGTAWERLGTPAAPEEGDGLAVAAFGGGWIAGGGAVRMGDGTSWRTSDGTATALVAGHGTAVRATSPWTYGATQAPVEMARSTDGSTWTSAALGTDAARVTALAVTPDGFAAVGVTLDEDEAFLWTSADAQTWAAASVPLLDGIPAAIAAGPGTSIVIVTNVSDGAGDSRPAALVLPPVAASQPSAAAPTRNPWTEPHAADTGPLDLGGSVTAAAVAVLADGRLLVAGGTRVTVDDPYGSGDTLLLDPLTGDLTTAPALPAPVAHAAAVTAPDGRTWVLGSSWGSEGAGSGFVLDAAAGAWTHAPAPLRNLDHVAVAAMPDGRLLVVDGALADGALLLFDPATGAAVRERLPFAGPGAVVAVSADAVYIVTAVRAWWRPLDGGAWTAGPLLPYAAGSDQPSLAATVLPDGRLAILASDVLGPSCSTDAVRSVLEILNPPTGTWSAVSLPQARIGAAMAALPGGLLTVIGGYRRTLEDCGWSAETDLTDDGLLVTPPG